MKKKNSFFFKHYTLQKKKKKKKHKSSKGFTILRQFGGAELRLDDEELFDGALEGQGVDALHGIFAEVRTAEVVGGARQLGPVLALVHAQLVERIQERSASFRLHEPHKREAKELLLVLLSS